jgi:hypothetical protein
MKVGQLKDIAHSAITEAIRKGILVRPNKCDICFEDSFPHAHHDDDHKPLEVVWLCHYCHQQRHRMLRDLLKKDVDLAYERGVNVAKSMV